MEANQMLRELNACSTLCNICYQACLYENDKTQLNRCIELTRDCAEICLLTASFFARNSPGAIPVIKLCAEMCEACSVECAQYTNEYCINCAQVCATCAELCQGYISWYQKLHV